VASTRRRAAILAADVAGYSRLIYTGSLDEMIPLGEKASRLSPRAHDIGYRYLLIGPHIC
jgi:hypothetical protein